MEEKVLEESDEMKIRIQKGNLQQITACLRRFAKCLQHFACPQDIICN